VPGAPPASGARLPLSPEAAAPLPLSDDVEPRLALSAAGPVLPEVSKPEDVPRPEGFEASGALWPVGDAAPWPADVAELTGKPAAKFARTPPPDGTAIQMRKPRVAVPAATARDRGPFDAPRHHRRNAGNGPSARLMGDLAPTTGRPRLRRAAISVCRSWSPCPQRSRLPGAIYFS
jgi:hypothetical protein